MEDYIPPAIFGQLRAEAAVGQFEQRGRELVAERRRLARPVSAERFRHLKATYSSRQPGLEPGFKLPAWLLPPRDPRPLGAELGVLLEDTKAEPAPERDPVEVYKDRLREAQRKVRTVVARAATLPWSLRSLIARCAVNFRGCCWIVFHAGGACLLRRNR